MTPQEKKRLSLEKDCRNVFGENDKSSRKAIRRRKQRVNRAFRRATHVVLNEGTAETIADEIGAVRRKHWKKVPDRPLGTVLARNRGYALECRVEDAARGDEGWFEALEKFLKGRGVTVGACRVILRRARAVSLDRGSASLDLGPEESGMLEEFLRKTCGS